MAHDLDWGLQLPKIASQTRQSVTGPPGRCGLKPKRNNNNPSRSGVSSEPVWIGTVPAADFTFLRRISGSTALRRGCAYGRN
jgi:hypothetical protein